MKAHEHFLAVTGKLWKEVGDPCSYATELLQKKKVWEPEAMLGKVRKETRSLWVTHPSCEPHPQNALLSCGHG